MGVTSRPISSSTNVLSEDQQQPRPRLAPPWAHRAAAWMIHQPTTWQIIGGILGVLMVVIGGSLLFGGGYTSIQGVRVPLALLLAPWGIVVETDGMPTLVWWIIALWGIIGTLVGFAITINAERFFLAGCLLVTTAITRRH
jgi:hypothetical protein